MDLAPLTTYAKAINSSGHTSSSILRAYAHEQVQVTRRLDERLMRVEAALAAIPAVEDGTLNEALAAVRALKA
jgi:hypothetical protein